jgi:hypothetical protein
MNEMDREMILAERGEKRDNRREDLLVREKLKEQRERNAAAKRSSSRAKSGLSEKAAQVGYFSTGVGGKGCRKEHRARTAAANSRLLRPPKLRDSTLGRRKK